MARMTGFVFQDEYLERLAKLSDQEVGRLVRALAEYHATGKEQELAGREGVAYDFIKVDIDRIDQKYEARCETNKNNRQQSSTIVNKQQPTPTNGNQTDQDKDKYKDKDKVKETVLTDSKEKAVSLDRAFDKFWACYPRHTAKQDAKRAFLRVSPDDTLLDTMLSAIQRQKQSAQWSDPRYIPHPATWLNGRRWEDETQGTARPLKPVSAAQYEQRTYDEKTLEDQLGVNDIFSADWKGAG